MNNNSRGAQGPGITYFICYKNYRKYLSKLSPEQVGQLHLALYDFAFDGAITQFDELAMQLLYEIMTDQIARDSGRYLTKVENGRKGGRPRKDAETQKPKKTSQTASESHSDENSKTEAKPEITENNQEEDNEYEEDKYKENEEDKENDKGYPVSSPQKEETGYPCEEDDDDEEYNASIPEQSAQVGGRGRLGAPRSARLGVKLDEMTVQREPEPDDSPDEDEDRLWSLLNCSPPDVAEFHDEFERPEMISAERGDDSAEAPRVIADMAGVYSHIDSLIDAVCPDLPEEGIIEGEDMSRLACLAKQRMMER